MLPSWHPEHRPSHSALVLGDLNVGAQPVLSARATLQVKDGVVDLVPGCSRIYVEERGCTHLLVLQLPARLQVGEHGPHVLQLLAHVLLRLLAAKLGRLPEGLGQVLNAGLRKGNTT